MKDNAWGIKIGDYRSAEERIPVYLPTADTGFCLHYDESSTDSATDFLENIVLHFVSEFPLGRLEVHLFDYSRKKRFPHLNDLKEFIPYHWLDNNESAKLAFQQLDERIANRHKEYLTRRTPNMIAHNAKSEFPESYHLVIINLEDFPNINLKQLQYFIEAAAAAGVFILGFTTNPEHEEQQEARDWLRQNLAPIYLKNKQFSFPAKTFPQVIFSEWFDFLPLAVDKDQLLNQLDAQSQAAKKDDPQPDYLSVKIGTTLDGNRPAELSLGQKTNCHHILLTGSTGSGKTALLNNLILRIGEKYNSDEFRLYLMDYKQGVEFGAFKDHPNVEQIYLDNSDIAAAEKMLESFCATCAERSKLFQQVEVSNLEDYNKLHPHNSLPRKLLIIDEFQVMFGGGNEFENWQQRAKINGLLSMITRQGRSFGVHLLLTTQSLLDVNLNDEIRAQIGLRMTFKLNDIQSARTVLQGDNTGLPLRLGQYQLLYNDQAGHSSANKVIRTDAPENITETIARIRTSRPAEKCLTPKIMTSSQTTGSMGNIPPAAAFQTSFSANMGGMQSPNFSGKFDTAQDEAILKKMRQQNGENEQ